MGTLLKVRFIQVSGLFWVRFIRFLVYSGFGLYRFLVYSGFVLDRFQCTSIWSLMKMSFHFVKLAFVIFWLHSCVYFFFLWRNLHFHSNFLYYFVLCYQSLFLSECYFTITFCIIFFMLSVLILIEMLIYLQQVPYSTMGWLEKNKDPINETVVELLRQSKEHLVATLFAPPAVPGLFISILWVRIMVFNTTFNNISIISWRSVLLVE